MFIFLRENHIPYYERTYKKGDVFMKILIDLLDCFVVEIKNEERIAQQYDQMSEEEKERYQLMYMYD